MLFLAANILVSYNVGRLYAGVVLELLLPEQMPNDVLKIMKSTKAE